MNIAELKELEEKATPNWHEGVTGAGVPCVSASDPEAYHGLPVLIQGQMVPNPYNISLAVAMRNALPELLQKAQQLEAAEARAVEAERQRDRLALELVNRTALLHNRWPGGEADRGYPSKSPF